MSILLSYLLILLPLLVASIVVAWKMIKAVKVRPLGPDEREILRDGGKSLVYLLAADFLVWLLVPPLGGVGTFFGFFISLLLAVLCILCVLMLPNVSYLSNVHNLMWRDGPVTPIYSRSHQPVQYIRWARRVAFLLFVLFAIITWFFGLLMGDESPGNQVADGSDPMATATAPATPTPVVTTTEPEPTTSATTPAPLETTPSETPAAVVPSESAGYVENPCYTPDNSKNGPRWIKKIDPVKTNFELDDSIRVCTGERFVAWDVAFGIDGNTPPTKVTTTAFTVVDGYAYAVITLDDGRTALIKTNKFKVKTS